MITFNLSSEFLWDAYLTIHVLYGLVTHYHSVLEVRKYNHKAKSLPPDRRPVSPFTVMTFFVCRMALGFPWMAVLSIVSPIGNKWHMSPREMQEAA